MWGWRRNWRSEDNEPWRAGAEPIENSMTLKEFEQCISRMREQGATDDTVVQGFESNERLTAFSGPITPKQRKKYFTVRDVCLGERPEEYGGGKVIRIYHYTV